MKKNNPIQDGDSVAASPEVLSAIIDIAEKLGIPTYGIEPNEAMVKGIIIDDHGKGLGPCTILANPLAPMSVEQFIDNLHATAKAMREPDPIESERDEYREALTEVVNADSYNRLEVLSAQYRASCVLAKYAKP